MEPVETFEHAGVAVEIVYDEDPGYGPQDHDNAGTIYSWVYRREFEGDKYIDTDDIYDDPTENTEAFFAEHYDAALTIPLYFADYGSSGARIYESDSSNPNCALVFTQKEIDDEWSGSVESARAYAEARVNELDQYFQGLVFGIVIRHPKTNEVMESVWGFIGEPNSEYILSEARAMAEDAAEQIAHEGELVQEWAARGVVTV